VELPKSHFAPVMNKRYEIITKGGVVAPNPPIAVVYLEGSFPEPAAPATVQMGQKNLEFVPMLLAVRVGTKVEFPNFDDVYHNIFSYSPVKRFDLGRYRSDEKPVPSQIFEKPGLVTLRCEIHEHMRGLILVLATPHFVLSDTEGRYRLAGLPAGHYTLKAWLDSNTTKERPVDLRDGATLEADFP
jgi:plastocyanin